MGDQADDAVERRSDVVAHAGKEAGFRGVGPVRLFHGGAQLFVGAAQFLRVLRLNLILLFPVALRRPPAVT